MAEYWKSLPRKFCDICKCWFADNKASIDFHERGKRHRENAQKRIQEIQKRGIKEFKKQKELEDEMEKIEKAALAAYEKDLRNMQKGDEEPQPDSQSIKKLVPKDTSKSTINIKSLTNVIKKEKKEISNEESEESSTSPVIPTPSNLWYEAITEEGYKYYYNSEESRWEPPEEGFVSIEEQNQANNETVSEDPQVSEENSSGSEENAVKEEKASDEIPSSMGPQPKVDPYGEWVTVEQKKPVEYDLQLPKPSEDIIEVYIPVHKEETSVNFKEKIIGQLSDSDSGAITFKKRKFAGSFKRNARQRTNDDD